MRKSFLVIILTLLLVETFVSTFNIKLVRAWTGTVCIKADGTINPPDAPIITHDNVTYTLSDNITSYEDGITVERNDIIVDGNGFTVQGIHFLYSKGIYLSGVQNVTVKNMNIQRFYYGILLNNTSNNIISGNNITDNQYGIFLLSSSYNSISENIVTANEGHGIYVESSSHNFIYTNNVAENKEHGVHLWENSLYNVISRNNVTLNNGNGVDLGHSGIYALTYNNISCNNVAKNNGTGVVLYHSSGNIVSENNITANQGHGMHTDRTTNNKIFRNNVTANKECGIHIWFHCSNTIISENNVMANSGHGILLECSPSNNIVSENNVTLNKGYGIFLGGFGGGGSDNIVFMNSIVANSGNGITLEESSSNIISGNALISNAGYGIYLASSTDNTIYHNNFISNVAWSDSANFWDDGYPSGGNYWSDYEGVDSCKGPYQNQNGSDGIGDAFYYIDTQFIDRYPLMAPFKAFEAGTFNGETLYVDVVSNSTLSNFDFNYGHPSYIKFDVEGPDGSLGFCRVTIPKELLFVAETCWKVTVDEGEVNYTVMVSEENTYLYFAYAHSKKIVLIQALVFYDLLIITTTGGTTDPVPGTYAYVDGTVVSVTAVPDVNYNFGYWILDGANAGSANPIEVFMNRNHALEAVFSQITCHLTISTTSGGTTDPSPGIYTYVNGTLVSATAIPNTGFSFNYWLLDGNVRTENPITLVMVENHTLEAHFVDDIPPTTTDDYDGSWRKFDFTITLTAVDHGSDVAETYYRINDGSVKAVGIDGQPLITTEGANNTLEYWSVDNAGNEELPHKILTDIKLDKTNPLILEVKRQPEGDVEPGQSVKVLVNATDSLSGIRNVMLSYNINNSLTWTNITMTLNTTTGLYEETIQGQQANTLVKYKVISYDNAGNLKVEDNHGQYYVYTVIPEFPSTMFLLLFLIVALALSVFKKKATKMKELT